MGGFHLVNAKPEVIQNTVTDIKAMKPDYIVPTHCTGFEALITFTREMPNELIINTSGTQYTFGSRTSNRRKRLVNEGIHLLTSSKERTKWCNGSGLFSDFGRVHLTLLTIAILSVYGGWFPSKLRSKR